MAKLTNNNGCMSKAKIEQFAKTALRQLHYPAYEMKWTTAGDILIGNVIYIDERHIDGYPWESKEIVLHEIAHIDTWPEDNRHGELFYRRYIELLAEYMT